jgi:DNA-binding response OmpR family regulator
MQHSPRVVSRQELETEIWAQQERDAGNLNVHLHKLRQVVDKPFTKNLIHTLVGIGVVVRDDNDDKDNFA